MKRPANFRAGAPFEILEHPADIGFTAYGRTLEELFENAGLAVMSLAYELEGIEEREQRTIEASGSDMESLLYAWLTEIVAISDGEQLVFRRFEVAQLGAGRARGTAHGEKFDKSRHRARTYIKAVTLHQFRIEQLGEGWSARVYLDV